MASNPKFDAILTQMGEIHAKKQHDYATAGNPYSNFEESAATAGCSVDTVFMVLMGIKLARLRELLSSGKGPENESVQDSRMDLAVYAALWASYQLAESENPWCMDGSCYISHRRDTPCALVNDLEVDAIPF